MPKVAVLGACGAVVGLRHVGFEDILGLVRHKNVYEPNPRHRELYGQLYGAFLNLFKSNRALLARLNRPSWTRPLECGKTWRRK